MKKILVVGNGFDLAHGLPTRYSDFLYFIALCMKNFSQTTMWAFLDKELLARSIGNILTGDCKNNKITELFDNNRKEIFDALNSQSTKTFLNNDLLQYLLFIYADKQVLAEEFKWIDVEDELLKLLSRFDSTTGALTDEKFYIKIPNQSEEKTEITTFSFSRISNNIKTFSEIPKERLKNKILEWLFEDLEQFSSLLKMYLNLIMMKFRQFNKQVFAFSSNIDDALYFSHIISFNYTNTSTMYNPKAEIYYVNGSLNDEKIILGVENPHISSYNVNYEDNVHLFFKNVQRVLYDFKYKHSNWMESNETDFIKIYKGRKIRDTSREVFIVGHSLALSDKYILLDIMEKSDKVTIYYYNDEDKKSKAMNLYKILGDGKFYRYINNEGHIKPKISLRSQKEIIL